VAVVFNPFNDLKKRLDRVASVAFIAPLTIGAFIYLVAKTAPFILLGLAVIGVAWLLRRFWRRWQD
jgi:hypothetical protein